MSRDHYVEDHPAEAGAHALIAIDEKLGEVVELLTKIADREVEKVRSEYQRFYDFVGEADPAIVDAWHFTENVRVQKEARDGG